MGREPSGPTLETGRVAVLTVRDKMNRRRAGAAIAVALALGGLVWHASLRVGEGPAAGTTFQGEAPPAADPHQTFRVATWNIHGGRGRDGRCDLDRTADCLRDVDLAGLNEVRGAEFPARDNQAAALGQRLDRAWLFAPAERRWHVQQFGNAFLARLGVRGWQRIPLPRVDDASHRNATLVVAEHEGQPVRVLLTHLTERAPRDREIQLGAVLRLFLALQEPAILMGDLNATAEDPQIQELLGQTGVEDVIAAHAADVPKGRGDWIFVRGLRCEAAGVVDRGASDHPLLWADLAWPEKEATPPRSRP